MAWLTLFITYNAVSITFAWPQFWQNDRDNNPTNDDLNNVLSSLFNDFQLDISFPSASNPPGSSFTDHVQTNDNYFVNKPLPASYTHFSGFISNPLVSKEAYPLYLTMQSPQTAHRSTYQLTKIGKVNGDTWRYSYDTNGNDHVVQQYIALSRLKLYICPSASCSNKRIEMNNILKGDQYTNYMHLVPTSTAAVFDTDTDDDAWYQKIVKWMNTIAPGSVNDTPLIETAFNMVNRLWNEDEYDAIEQNEDKQANVMETDGLMENESNRDVWYPMVENWMKSLLDMDDSIYDENMNDDGFEPTISDDLLDEYDTEMDDEITESSYDITDEDVARDETENEHFMSPSDDGEYDDYDAEDIDEALQESAEGTDGFMMNDVRVLVDDHEATNINSTHNNYDHETSQNLVLIEMTVIIIFLMVCGVVYALWRWMVDRREKKRELNYYNISNM
eukprot:1066753_1